MYKQAVINSVVAVILNIIFAYGLSPLASEAAKSTHPSKLGIYDKIMAQAVVHKELAITSSWIIFAMVLLSTLIGRYARNLY